jgi:hypothetical protein
MVTILMVLGAFIWGTLLAEVGDLHQSSAAKEQEKLVFVQSTLDFLEEQDVPGPLKKDIVQFTRFYMEHNSKNVNKKQMIQTLPDKLQRKLIHHCYHGLINKVPLFAHLHQTAEGEDSANFLSDLWEFLNYSTFVPGAEIVSYGGEPDRLVIFVSGKAHLQTESHPQQMDEEQGKGGQQPRESGRSVRFGKSDAGQRKDGPPSPNHGPAMGTRELRAGDYIGDMTLLGHKEWGVSTMLESETLGDAEHDYTEIRVAAHEYSFVVCLEISAEGFQKCRDKASFATKVAINEFETAWNNARTDPTLAKVLLRWTRITSAVLARFRADCFDEVKTARESLWNKASDPTHIRSMKDVLGRTPSEEVKANAGVGVGMSSDQWQQLVLIVQNVSTVQEKLMSHSELLSQRQQHTLEMVASLSRSLAVERLEGGRRGFERGPVEGNGGQRSLLRADNYFDRSLSREQRRQAFERRRSSDGEHTAYPVYLHRHSCDYSSSATYAPRSPEYQALIHRLSMYDNTFDKMEKVSSLELRSSGRGSEGEEGGVGGKTGGGGGRGGVGSAVGRNSSEWLPPYPKSGGQATCDTGKTGRMPDTYNMRVLPPPLQRPASSNQGSDIVLVRSNAAPASGDPSRSLEWDQWAEQESL